MIRLKVKTYSSICIMIVIIILSMLVGCSSPQVSTDKQTIEQQDSVSSGVNVPELATYDFGLCNIICRWQPTGVNAYLLATPGSTYVTIRPMSNVSVDSYQWHAYWVVTNGVGKMIFQNVKVTSPDPSIYPYNGGKWLAISQDITSDSSGYYTVSPGFELRLLKTPTYFSQENQQTVNGHLYQNLTTTEPVYGKRAINCEWYYNGGFPVKWYTSVPTVYHPEYTGWWSAQWWISWYSEN